MTSTACGFCGVTARPPADALYVDYALAIVPLLSVIAGSFVYAAGIRHPSIALRLGGIALMAAPLVWIAVVLLTASGE